MCRCRPEVRTPFCGRPGCEWPNARRVIIPRTVRPAEPGDVPLILSTWLKSYRNDRHTTPDPWGHEVPRELYFTRHKELILATLNRCGAIVACDPEESIVVHGWLCGEPSVLHYVYVKGASRGQGIATDMLAAGLFDPAAITVSHLTRSVNRWRERGVKVTLDPYAFFCPERIAA